MRLLPYLLISSDFVLNIVESSPNVTVNSIEDGVSGVLTNMENHAIGNIMIVDIAITIAPPINNLDGCGKGCPRLVSNRMRRLETH